MDIPLIIIFLLLTPGHFLGPIAMALKFEERKACRKPLISGLMDGIDPIGSLSVTQWEENGGREWSFNDQRAINRPNHKYRLQTKGRLGTFIIKILGPRGPKGKVFKSK